MWLGLAVTALCLAVALHGVDLREVGAVLAGARWPLLLALSIPSYLGVVWLRARRWRILTESIQPIGTGPLFRAVAVGFTANNLLPLRVGEVIRIWYLARETGASGAALLGTVVLERVIDTLSVVGLAVLVLALGGVAEGELIRRSALWLLPVALLPAALLLTLRAAPDRATRLLALALRPLPARWSQPALALLGRFGAGLGALSGGWHLLSLAGYSVAIWLVGSTLPVLAGFWALGLELGPPAAQILAGWTTLVAVALAVAIPSAPGFFGPYHVAAILALQRFGIGRSTAAAAGTLIHAVFWVTLTALGLLVLRLRRTSLAELQAAQPPPDPPGNR